MCIHVLASKNRVSAQLMSSHDEFWWFGPQKPWHPAITWQEKTKPCKPVKILDAYNFHDPSRSLLGLRQNVRLPNHADAANEGQVGWRSHQLGNSWCVGRQNHKVQVLAQIMAQERSVKILPFTWGCLGMDSYSTKIMNNNKKTTAKQTWFHQEDNSQLCNTDLSPAGTPCSSKTESVGHRRQKWPMPTAENSGERRQGWYLCILSPQGRSQPGTKIQSRLKSIIRIYHRSREAQRKKSLEVFLQKKINP